MSVDGRLSSGEGVNLKLTKVPDTDAAKENESAPRKRPLTLERSIAATHLRKDAYFSSLLSRSRNLPTENYQRSVNEVKANEAAERKREYKMPRGGPRVIPCAAGERNLALEYQTGDAPISLSARQLPVITEQMANLIASKEETLVPIRLSLEIDGVKLVDVFTFNAHDPLITPMYMAELICQDYGVSSGTFLQPIASAIVSQVEAFLYQTPRPLQRGKSPQGLLDSSNCKALVAETTSSTQGTELLIPIKLDIMLGSLHYLDTLEWDLGSKDSSPEVVSESIARDVVKLHGVSVETARDLQTAIACSIRQQLQAVGHSLLMGGMLEDSDTELVLKADAAGEEELQDIVLPSLTEETIYRDPVRKIYHEPFLEYLSELDEARYQQSLEKEKKKRRKLVRARRIPLVDPDTYRSARLPLPTHESSKPQGHQSSQGSSSHGFGSPQPSNALPNKRPTRQVAAGQISYAEESNNDDFVLEENFTSRRPNRHL